MRRFTIFLRKLNEVIRHLLITKSLASLLVILLCAPVRDAVCIDEVWAFQHFALERTNDREFFLSIHERAKGSDIPTLFQIQPRATFAIGDWTWAGFNYSFFGIRRQDNAVANEDLFTHQNRLEAEVQFRGRVSDGTRYVGRNRFEYLMDSEFRNLNERFRHRSQFLFSTPFHDQIMLLSQIELFFDFGASRLNQTRTAPLGLRYIHGPWAFQAQPMFVHFDPQNTGWRSNLIANFEITYDF